MPPQLPTHRIAKTTQLLYGLLLLFPPLSFYTTRVVLNTLGVEDNGIYKVVVGMVSMFAFVNGVLTLANGWKSSGAGSVSMKTTAKLSGILFPTIGAKQVN